MIWKKRYFTRHELGNKKYEVLKSSVSVYPRSRLPVAAGPRCRTCWAPAVQYVVPGRLARLIYMFDNACSEQSTSQQPHTKGVPLGVPELGPRNRSCSCGRRRVTHSWCDLVPGTDPCFCHVLFWVASPAEHRTVHEFWLCISHGSPCLQASL